MDGYRWSGSGGDVAALLARAQELRLSGRLALTSGKRRVTVDLLAGEPQSPPPEGDFDQFEMTQAMPDLAGRLGEGFELAGSLAKTRLRDLLRHCEARKLTAELQLTRSAGESALVRIAKGSVESAEVGGVPELGALAKIERWQEGTFRLVLRPLFGVARTGRVSGGMNAARVSGSMAAARPPSVPPAAPTSRPPTSAATAPATELVKPISDLRPPVISRPAPRRIIEDIEVPPGLAERVPRGRLGPVLWLLGITIVLALAVGGVWLVLHPARHGGAPVEETIVLDPSVKVVAKTPEPEAPAQKPKKPAAAPASTLDPETARRVAKGRRLLVAGHPHSAADEFTAAYKRTHDDTIGKFIDMAKGKTGNGELVLEGAGTATVCGESVTAPKTLKLPAGPYTVEHGGTSEEIDVPKKGRVAVHLP